MAITKHGVGDVLPEPEDNQKTAQANWSDADEQGLAEELEEDAPE